MNDIIEQFREIRAAMRKNEVWRNVDFGEMVPKEMVVPGERQSGPEAYRCNIPDLRARRLTLVNGHCQEAWHVEADGTAYGSLREAMAACPVRDLKVATRLRPDGLIEVTVEDTGPGIADEVREQLFTAFKSTKADGMGLGLSICRTIIEAHGGRIWMERPDRGGARFHFTLIHARAEEEHGG